MLLRSLHKWCAIWITILLNVMVSDVMMQWTASSDASCTYTFHVPKDVAAYNSCPGGGATSVGGASGQSVDQLATAVANLQTQLTTALTQLADVNGELNKLKMSVAKLGGTSDNDDLLNSHSIGGAVYVRWGRSECPGDAVKLYEGGAAGAHQGNSGGGSNYLCLPTDPQWRRYSDGVHNDDKTRSSLIYGTEYQTYANSPFSTTNMPGNASHYNHDVTCAVCHSWRRLSSVMIPARSECPRGWIMEYQGYLVADHGSARGRSEYVCLDDAPEALPGGSANVNGALFYVVEGRCGALRCPPYVEGREIACIVCTK